MSGCFGVAQSFACFRWKGCNAKAGGGEASRCAKTQAHARPEMDESWLWSDWRKHFTYTLHCAHQHSQQFLQIPSNPHSARPPCPPPPPPNTSTPTTLPRPRPPPPPPSTPSPTPPPATPSTPPPTTRKNRTRRRSGKNPCSSSSSSSQWCLCPTPGSILAGGALIGVSLSFRFCFYSLDQIVQAERTSMTGVD